MPERPLVSVVTPTLNQAPFLERTLASVRGQSYPRIEHIVIDGGSTDGTLDVLRHQQDAGSIRYITEPDKGMYDAVNKGLALATGEILAYLNSDDAWLPWAVERVVAAFERRPKVDVVFGDGMKIEEGTGVQRLRLFPPFDRVSLANYESLMQPAVFWRRNLLDRVGSFDSRLRYVADLDYWLRAAAAGARIVHVKEVLAIERIHEGRLSSSQHEAMAEEDREMRARHAGAAGGPEGRLRAKERDMRWQRRLWLTFYVASRLRRLPIPRPWGRFIRDGRLKLRRKRMLEGSKPYQAKHLGNAVVSGLAADVIVRDAPAAN